LINKNKVYSFFNKKYLLILFLALILTILHQSIFFRWTCDDSFISFRYSENLSKGYGLVFNIGEKVEGYSNFLWVIILAFLKIIGIPTIYGSKIISFVISLFLIFLVYKTANLMELNKTLSSYCSLALSLSTGIAYFAMSGLETIFYIYVLFLSIYINEKYEMKPTKKLLSALYLSLLIAALLRPEGVLFICIATLYHLIRKLKYKIGINFIEMIKIQISVFLTYGLFILFRYCYYGEILPNTYYAKPGGTFAEYEYNAFISNFIKSFFSGSFLLLALLFFLFIKDLRKKYALPLSICTGQIIFMSYTGDWMAFGRFFLPILPIVILLFFILFQYITQRKIKKMRKLFPIFFIILYAGLNIHQTQKALINKDSNPYSIMNSTQLKKIGILLHNNFHDKTTIALKRQGAIPYYSEMKSIDILGLTEEEIAKIIYSEKDIIKKNRLIVSYTLKRKPDIILIFPNMNIEEGWIYNKYNPHYKFHYNEYLLFKNSVQKEYKIVFSFPFGSDERVIFLLHKNNLF